MLTIPSDHPLDALLLAILGRADAAARETGINYFVSGALARDLILLHVFGKDTGRATRDVDLGICIDDWQKLETLRTHLIRGGDFFAQSGMAHRLIYRPTARTPGLPLDLLPYGGVERSDGTIAWPPGMEIVMNVAGFAEACASALMVKASETLTLPVASLPSLAVLKLIAWRERRLETPKDATDFLLIARHYADAGNLDRLYETEQGFLQAADFNPELAGVMLLGKDAATICTDSTMRTMTEILIDAQLTRQLVDQLLRATLLSGENATKPRAEQFVDAFRMGFEDAGKR